MIELKPEFVILKKEHETQKRICKLCKIEKDWLFHKISGMARLYKEANGHLWNGPFCRDCSCKRFGTAYQKKRMLRQKARRALAKEQPDEDFFEE